VANIARQAAQFISAMFGKNVAEPAVKSFESLGEAAHEMADDIEEAEKAVKGSLAGFDEINNMMKEETKDDSLADLFKDFGDVTGGLDFGGLQSPVEMTTDAFDKLYDKIKGIKDVFVKAWKNAGAPVIDSLKNIGKNIKDIFAEIASDFMDVFQSDLGLKTVESIINSLSSILGIVDSITAAFRKAWTENNRGAELIASIFNKLRNVMNLITDIGISFKTAWDAGVGVSIISNILGIMTNINNIIGNLAERLRIAWNENDNGLRIWDGILSIIDSVLEGINKLTGLIADWASEINFEPMLNGFANLIESINPFVDLLIDGLLWAYINILAPFKTWLIDLVVPAALGILAATFDVIVAVLEALKPLGAWLWDKFLKPIAEWTGGVIVKTLDGLGDSLTRIAGWIKDTTQPLRVIDAILIGLGVSIGLVAAGLAGYKAILPIITAKTLAFNVVLKANPIGLVIVAIAALIAGIVLLIANFDEVREVAQRVIDWFKNNWQSIVAFVLNPFAGIFKYLYDNFEGFRDFVDGIIENVVNFFTVAGDKIRDVWSKILSWFTNKILDPLKDGFKNTFNSVIGFVEGMANKVINGIESMVNGAIKLLNNLISGMNKIPGVNIPEVPNLKIPRVSLPRLARGGIVDEATIAMIGEQGKEAVMPLENNTDWMTDLANMIGMVVAQNIGGGQTGSGGKAYFNLNGREFAEAIIDDMESVSNRRGSNFMRIRTG
jgi:hypothetical protein